MPATPEPQNLEIATFESKSGPQAQRVTVQAHFNPESLQYTVQNTLKEEGKGAKKKQHVSQTTAKLTMQLVFDTTDTGEDIRLYTDDMAKLLQPYKDGNNKAPPIVEFGWGVYRFTGVVEQYKETIDFFAAAGVPLRSTVDVTLSSNEPAFESSHSPSAAVDGDLSAEEPTVHPQAGPGQNTGPGGAAGLANALGDPRAARAIASLNGSASLRFGAGASLAVGGGVQLQAAAAFSTGISASAGIGIGAGAGIGIGASAGAGIGVSAGASGGAFSGLRASASSSLSLPSGRALFAAGSNVSTGASAQFAAGGRAEARGSASLSTDVGANADLSARITFG